MKALVLGGNGFIGSHLVDKLLNEGHSVRIYDKRKEKYRDALKDVEYYYGDFENHNYLANSLENVDVVYHLISTTIPSSSVQDISYDISSNTVNTINLLDLCVKKKVSKIVYFSSGGTIYGTPQTLPINEDHPTNPICAYGISKLAIEKYLFLYNHLYSLDYIIIRPSNAYGERQDPFGEQGVIPIFLKRAILYEAIEIWGDIETIRDYIFITDLIDGVYKASVNSNIKNRIFNFGGGIEYSLKNILEIIQLETKLNMQVKHLPRRLIDVTKIKLDINRAKIELGWEPSTTINHGIHRTYNFVKECLGKISND